MSSVSPLTPSLLPRDWDPEGLHPRLDTSGAHKPSKELSQLQGEQEKAHTLSFAVVIKSHPPLVKADSI